MSTGQNIFPFQDRNDNDKLKLFSEEKKHTSQPVHIVFEGFCSSKSKKSCLKFKFKDCKMQKTSL